MARIRNIYEFTQIRYDASTNLAASTLGISNCTLRTMVRTHEIPSYCYIRYSYRSLKYSLQILNQWILNPNDAEAAAMAKKHHQISSNFTRGTMQPAKNTIQTLMNHLDFKFNTTEDAASQALGISRWSLREMRYSGKLPAYTYRRVGVKLIRYSMALLNDYFIDPNDLEAQARAQAVFEASRISSPTNLPEKT